MGVSEHFAELCEEIEKIPTSPLKLRLFRAARKLREAINDDMEHALGLLETAVASERESNALLAEQIGGEMEAWDAVKKELAV